MGLEPLIREQLESIVGANRVLSSRTEILAHAYDALRPFRGRLRGAPSATLASKPDAVVLPATTDDVAAILRLASAARIPVTPFGGGTGLMGGAQSPRGGIVVDLGGMNRVLEVSPVNRTVTAQSGALLADVDRELSPMGLMLGHDPWTFSIATVGGAISTGGVGYLAGKYGGIGEQVLALEVALADGRVLSTRAAARHATGPDLTRLFVGAEGTLGIITAATLRAFPRPECERLAGYQFGDFAASFDAVLALEQIGLQPAVLDLGEQPPDPESTLYLGFIGFREECAAAYERADRICRASGGTPLPSEEVEDFWSSRHDVAERYRRSRELALEESPPGETDAAFDFIHVALPPSRVLEYRDRVLTIAAEHGVQVREVGLWINSALFSVALYHESGQASATELMAEVIDKLLILAQDIGGSMEYVHGIGIRLGHLMPREVGSSGMHTLQLLKDALDPHNILNPGKLGLKA